MTLPIYLQDTEEPGKQLSPVFLNALYAAKILHRTGRAINVETVWRF